jgi:hypothetical protein
MKYPFLIFFGSLLLFVPLLGKVHLFDWDEINFAECAREMIVSGNYSVVQVDFFPFWEKPPLFIWMQVLSMKVFGINEFAARFPNAVCGAATLSALFMMGRKISGDKFAWKWVLMYAGSLLPQFYFRTGVIDPWFNLFIFIAIYQFVNYTNELTDAKSPFINRRIIISGLVLSLAVLTKGPVALLIFALCFLAYRFIKRKPIMLWKHFALYIIAAVLPAAIWFVSLVAVGKAQLIIDFVVYQIRLFSTEDAGHGHNFFYHWYVILIGCFPASIFALHGLFRNGNVTPYEKHTLLWMRILFWVVLILFSIVKTKIIHYASMTYFPLTFLAAHSITQLETGNFRIRKWIGILFVCIGVVLGTVMFALPFADQLIPSMIRNGLVNDKFAEASFLAGTDWVGYEWFIGFLVLLVSVYSGWRYFKGKIVQSWNAIAFSGVITFSLAMMILVPHVEDYTQNAAIEFWKSKRGDDCYVETLGYKSYAQYFYSESNPMSADGAVLYNRYIASKDEVKNHSVVNVETTREWKREWLLLGSIDKPVYFISKNTYEKDVRDWWPHLIKTGEKNGFVFWMRMPDNSN